MHARASAAFVLYPAALSNIDRFQLAPVLCVQPFQADYKIPDLSLRFVERRRITRVCRCQVVVPCSEVVHD